LGKIKFLGTAGARVVVTKQLRSSGGIWLSLNGTNILIDPGPGCLVRCVKSRPKLNPTELDAIILTHKHLDHSGDVNIMIEAMTEGGFKKRGTLFAPQDALEGEDYVVFRYLRKFLEKIEVLKEGGKYRVGNISFTTPKRHEHRVETYGLNVSSQGYSLSLISDTGYFEGLEKYYSGSILILNVVRLEPKPGLDHLNIKDAERIISLNQPELAILTHFGMTMLRARPWEIAKKLEEKSGVKVLAAGDGTEVNLDEYSKD